MPALKKAGPTTWKYCNIMTYSMTKENGIITDFDNLMVRTHDFIRGHIVTACQRTDVRLPAVDAVNEVLRKNLRFEDIFTQLFGLEAEKVLVSYRVDAAQTPYKAMDGGEEFFSRAHDLAIPVVIVSNRANLLDVRLKQADYNPAWFLIKEAKPPKPSQEAYSEAIALLEGKGVKRLKITIFGDHPDDYLACPDDLRPNFVAVLTGLTTAEEFEKVGVAKDKIWQKLEAQRLSLT